MRSRRMSPSLLSQRISSYYPSTATAAARQCQHASPLINIRITKTATASSSNRIIDLCSDTVTQQTCSKCNDVMNKAPTILALQEYSADLFGKEAALYVPQEQWATCAPYWLIVITIRRQRRFWECILIFCMRVGGM